MLGVGIAIMPMPRTSSRTRWCAHLANSHLWQPGTNLRAWLVTIMRNQFFTTVAQSGRANALMATVLTSAEASAREGQETRLELRDLGSAIRRLPLKQRLAILFVAVEDKSYEEVAEAMQTSIGAVRCHLARGRARLREIVNKTPDHSPFATAKSRSTPGSGRRAYPSALKPVPDGANIRPPGTGRAERRPLLPRASPFWFGWRCPRGLGEPPRDPGLV